MKVLIINPPWPGKGFGTRSQNRIIKRRADKYLQYPLFLGYAAAQLKRAGHEVAYIDSIVQELSPEETWRKVKETSPDVIFMETTTPSIEFDFQDMIIMKELTGATIIAGGSHVTYFPQDSLRECKALDIVIKREFDTKIVPVLDNLSDLTKVDGIAFRRGEEIIDTGEPELIDDLDSLPFPDRDIVPYKWYLEGWYSRKPFINIITSRGCPYQCTFCLWPNAMYGHKQRFRSLDNVIEELKFVVRKYGVKEINVDDSNFTTRKDRVMEFCQKLRENRLNLLWTCNGRVDNVDDEMLREMKASGCKMIRYGVESGSPEVLNKIKKGFTLEQVERAFKLTKKHGILTLGGFMFGFPYDTRESIEQTLELAKKLSPDQVQFSICMPYPGTAIYEEAKENGWLITEQWREYDMTHGPVMKMADVNREELRHILARAYREFYFRPKYFLQTLGNIKDFYELRRVTRSALSVLSLILFHRRR